MKRHEFSQMVSMLLAWIDSKGWYALISYAERSREEQKRLFQANKTKCDGEIKISAHQYQDAGGKYAIDIYIHDGDGNIQKKQLYLEAHQYWDMLDGIPMDDGPMIEWDWAHFEAQ